MQIFRKCKGIPEPEPAAEDAALTEKAPGQQMPSADGQASPADGQASPAEGTAPGTPSAPVQAAEVERQAGDRQGGSPSPAVQEHREPAWTDAGAGGTAKDGDEDLVWIPASGQGRGGKDSE